LTLCADAGAAASRPLIATAAIHNNFIIASEQFLNHHAHQAVDLCLYSSISTSAKWVRCTTSPRHSGASRSDEPGKTIEKAAALTP
jgi:hypothetical protein